MVCPLRANVGCRHDKLDYCSVLANGHYNIVHTYDDKDTKFYEKYEASKAFYTWALSHSISINANIEGADFALCFCPRCASFIVLYSNKDNWDPTLLSSLLEDN